MQRSSPRLPAQTDLVAGSRRRPSLVLDGTFDDPNTGAVLQERRCADPATLDGRTIELRRHGEKRVASFFLGSRIVGVDDPQAPILKEGSPWTDRRHH